MNNNFESLPEVLTAKDISQYLGISYSSALKLIRYNMAFLKLGNTYCVTLKNFLNFLDSDAPKEAVINP